MSKVTTIPCPIQVAAGASPNASALLSASRQYTYSEYNQQITNVAAHLQRRGVREGDYVVLCMPPGPLYPLILMGLMRMGAVAVPVNDGFPVDYLRQLLTRMPCSTLIAPYGSLLFEQLEGIHTVASGELMGAEDGVAKVVPEDVPRDWKATGILTSGSSGTPKLALHTYGNHYHNAMLSNQNISVAPGDVWLLSLPLYHVSGLSVLFRCALGRACVAVPEKGESIPAAINRYKVTYLSLVPTQLHRLMEDAASVLALKKLKAILLGGSAVSEQLLWRAVGAGLRIHTTYGLTEMGSQVTTTSPGAPLETLKTSGLPLDNNAVRISAEGEIQVRGACRFLGYWVDNALSTPFDAEGWFSTGDLGQFDAQGRLRVKGRRDNMFIVSGENVQPEEIEVCLKAQAGVLEAYVVPAHHAVYGATPVAFVQFDDETFTSNGAVQEALQDLLPKYKVPRFIFPVPDELRGRGIKIPRIQLQERANALLEQVE